MKSLFKRMGYGIMFTILLPIYLLAFAIFTLYSLTMFIFTFFASIPAYFKGESVFGHSEIDIAAATKIMEAKQAEEMAKLHPISTQPVNPQPTTTIIINGVIPQGDQQQGQITHQNARIIQQINEPDPVNIAENIIEEIKND